MMRVCHLNTCPVGVATQDPELRARFSGKPEHVVNYMIMVAEEARKLMASLGIRRFGDLVGRTELLAQNRRDPPLEGGFDRPGAAARGAAEGASTRRAVSSAATPRSTRSAPPSTSAACSARPGPRSRTAAKVEFETTVTNIDLAVGGRVSNALVVARGADGLPDDTISYTLNGSAGQTAGAWLAPGITINVHGDVNDYAGKGMSGGILAVRPDETAELQGRAQRDRRQRRPLRRHRRQGVLPRPRRRALRRPQLRRPRGRRGDRRARLRVHDRRLRGRPRPDRPQLRRRHERRHRLHLGPRRRVRAALQHGDGRARAGPPRRQLLPPRPRRRARPADRLARSPSACSTAGRRPPRSSSS